MSDINARAQQWARFETEDTASLAEIREQVRRAYVGGALSERAAAVNEIAALRARVSGIEAILASLPAPVEKKH